MEIVSIVRRRDWVAVFGYVLFVGALAAGYFYNLTFVQLGLVDVGTRVVGLPAGRVAAILALLAGVTLVVAIATGTLMHRRGWSARFVVKLRLLAAAVVILTVLTPIAPGLGSEGAMVVWVVLAAVALGIGVPSMFGLTCDLVPTRDRGWVAAVITSAAFLPAAVLATEWEVGAFARMMVGPMVLGALGLGVLAFAPVKVTQALGRQHEDPRYGVGRFVRRPAASGEGAGGGTDGTPRVGFAVALVLMFGIYFIDSLGFLRIIDTPVYMGSAWHSGDSGTVWMIGGAHVLAAVVAGILYPAFTQRALFGWVFALFGLVQLEYVLHSLTTPELPASLGLPLVYAMAVSIYTVLNFALWADFSTPATIARNAALGVGISGWLASFLSTSLAILWRSGGVTFAEHLRAVAAISLALLCVSGVLLMFPTRRDPT